MCDPRSQPRSEIQSYRFQDLALVYASEKVHRLIKSELQAYVTLEP